MSNEEIGKFAKKLALGTACYLPLRLASAKWWPESAFFTGWVMAGIFVILCKKWKLGHDHS